MRKSLFLLFLLLPALVLAKSGHMTLLTVVQQGNLPPTGGTADLYLDVRPGTGSIFIDSFPLTKIDTQISTRFANQVACSYLEMDCSTYDFFYRIEANSPIVGGPSAGGAITVLTVAVLKDLSLDNETVMTGTIDTGGLLGPVSGIYEKALAAQNAGFKKILIPKWAAPTLLIKPVNLSNLTKSRTNVTISIALNQTNQSDLLRNLTIQVIKIGNLDDAVYHFTGQTLNNRSSQIEINPDYTRIMQRVAEDLCNRTRTLQNMVDKKKLNYTDQNNLTKRANATYESAKYYATASYCFSQNIRLLNTLLENRTQADLLGRAFDLGMSTRQLSQKMDNHTLQTLSDLETYMIVKERTVEVLDTLASLNATDVSASLLAYALERYHSARVWSEFFGIPGNPLLLDKDHLKESCQKKISEAEERLSYVELYAPGYLSQSREELGRAYEERGDQSYAMCLFTASKVKAEADVFITVMGIDTDQLTPLAKEQLLAARRIIAKEQQKGLFPILGYSYLEYAESLLNDNPIASVTFSQYALELSNLDMYFPPQRLYTIPSDYMIAVLCGVLLGALGMRFYQISRRHK